MMDRVIPSLLVCGLLVSTALAGPNPPEHPSSADPDPVEDGPKNSAASRTTSASSEPLVRELPDDGPRMELMVDVEEVEVLRSAREALNAERYDAALWAFRRVEEQAANQALVPIARAFRAETLYRRESAPRSRFEVIELYQSLVREFPASANASRAGWRVGDLFAEQGWEVEAQAAYERAAKDALFLQDQIRAFLGLALVQLDGRRWSAAVQTLKGLRNNEMDDVSRGWVAFGMAEGLYGLRRRGEAAEWYRKLSERWPERLRRSPEVLLHVADVERELGREDTARRALLLFYNLFPKHREAPSALVNLGDSHRRSGSLAHAELFYGLAVQWNRESDAAHLARLRLAELGQALARRDDRHPLALEVAAEFQDGLRAPLSPAQQREVYQSISDAQQGTAVGSEALFHLAGHYLERDQPDKAQEALRRACEREGRVAGDVWPAQARAQLAVLLRPAMAAAIRMADDFQVVQIFHRYGSCPDWKGAHIDLVLHVAESHRRLGFAEPAIKLYQHVLRDAQGPDLRQYALIGIGRTYLDQRDAPAARNVFERYLLEFPLGALKGDALKYLAESWTQMGDAGAVIKAGQRWFQWHGAQAVNDPGYGPMLLRLAGAQAAVGRYPDAIRTLQEAERSGVMPYVQARLREGRYLEANGTWRAALAQWAEVVRAEPRSTEAALARLHMARVWWQQRRWAEADVLLSRMEQSTDGDVLSRAATVLKAAADVHRRVVKEEKP